MAKAGDKPGDTRTELREYLSTSGAQEQIRRVVVARMGGAAPDDVIDDLIQQTNAAAIGARSPPRSMATAAGWVATIAARTVVNHLRRNRSHRRWLDPKADPDEQPGEPPEAADDHWLISTWLAPLLADSPRDQETYELLREKARTGKTYAELAAEHGISEAAMKSRTHELKVRFEPQWRRRRDALVLVVLFGAIVIVAAAVIAWLVVRLTRPARPIIGPDWAPPRVSAVAPPPSPSTSDDPFAPAQSATPSRPPPENLKPPVQP